MESFTTQRDTVRIVFGAGAVGFVADELERMGANRPVWVSSARAVGSARQLSAGAEVLGIARQHVPGEVADAAAARTAELAADVVVAYGGGSAIGLAKAVALQHDVRVAAIPTTYSGSEMTPIYGLTRDGDKTTGRDERVRPQLVVYDPELTYGLPEATSVTSAMNAMAHAVEALYAPDATGAIVDDSERSIAALAGAIPTIVTPQSRADALYGAYLAGGTLGHATLGVHHKLCHVLGGAFGLPHAATHTVVLPHAIRYNADAAPEAIARVAAALGVADAAAGVWDLARATGAPTDLATLGLRDTDLDRAAALATSKPYPNPRPVDVESIRAMLADALAGRRPAR